MPTIYDQNGKPHFKAHMINAKECVDRGGFTWDNPKKRKPIKPAMDDQKSPPKVEAPMPLEEITEEFLSGMNKIPMIEFVEKRLGVDLDRTKRKDEILMDAVKLVENAKK